VVPSLPPDACRTRFSQGRVATLATVNAGGGPDLVPVTFAVVHDTVVSAVDHKPKSTRRLQRLTNIERDPAVTLLVHEYSDRWDELWWVRVTGAATVVDEPRAELRDALVGKYAPYRGQPPGGPFVVVTIRHWSGWAATDWAATATDPA
jgi:PPOX class probable F420-dependent enzyme